MHAAATLDDMPVVRDARTFDRKSGIAARARWCSTTAWR